MAIITIKMLIFGVPVFIFLLKLWWICLWGRVPTQTIVVEQNGKITRAEIRTGILPVNLALFLTLVVVMAWLWMVSL